MEAIKGTHVQLTGCVWNTRLKFDPAGTQNISMEHNLDSDRTITLHP